MHTFIVYTPTIVMQLDETMMDAWLRVAHQNNGLPYVKGQVHPDLLKALAGSQQALDWMYLLNGYNPL